MKNLLLLFYFLPSVISLEKSNLNAPIKKEWIQDQKLIWDDFTGKPGGLSKYNASTSAQFEYNVNAENDSVDFKTLCYFRKDLSWVKDRSNNLLEHEQLHFDIVEYHKREFERQSLQLIKLNRLKKFQVLFRNIDALFIKMQTEKDKAQSLYDKETEHGRNLQVQKRWRQKYNELLGIDY